MWRIVLAAVFFTGLSSVALAGSNPKGVAVIIGNQSYGGDIPQVDFAHRDAEAIKRFVIDMLGFDEKNILDLRDATKAQVEAVFGNNRNHKGKLWRYADQEGGSDIVVFYSGHGVPGLNDNKGYLLPSDSSPEDAEINGFPLEVMYQNLEKINARSRTVLLDACFSGLSHRGSLIKSASPVFVNPIKIKAGPGTAVLAAAGGSQLASWDEKAQHGLFTEYFLRGVYGDADADKNGLVSIKEIKSFLDSEMSKVARREYGREQNVSIQGNSSLILAAFVPGRPPIRPELPSAIQNAAKPALSNDPVLSAKKPQLTTGSVSRFNGIWKWATASNSPVCSLAFGPPAEFEEGKFSGEISHLQDHGIQMIWGSIDKEGKVKAFTSGEHVSVDIEGLAEGSRAVGIAKVRGNVMCDEPWVAYRISD